VILVLVAVVSSIVLSERIQRTCYSVGVCCFAVKMEAVSSTSASTASVIERM
jgi:hypothetical protein